DRLEKCERYILADDRRRLEEPLVFRLEAIDAGRKDRLGGRWYLHVFRCPGQAINAGFANEHVGFDQGPHALFQEKWISLSSRYKELTQGIQSRVVSHKGPKQLFSTDDGQRVNAQHAKVGLPDPGVLVLGPVIDKQKQLCRWHALDEPI